MRYVLFIGMLCLITLDFNTFDAVKAESKPILRLILFAFHFHSALKTSLQNKFLNFTN